MLYTRMIASDPFVARTGYPKLTYAEIDEDEWVVRCIELQPDGTLVKASLVRLRQRIPEAVSLMDTAPKPEYNNPDDDTLIAECITERDFERLWAKAEYEDSRTD